jgi:hypothetical protein
LGDSVICLSFPLLLMLILCTENRWLSKW